MDARTSESRAHNRRDVSELASRVMRSGRRSGRSRRAGRPQVPGRTVLAGILYRLRSDRTWRAMPGEFN